MLNLNNLKSEFTEKLKSWFTEKADTIHSKMEEKTEPAIGETVEINENTKTEESEAHENIQLTDKPEIKASPMRIFAAIFNGLGVGLILGVLLGLAVSPVVSGVIGTLSSILLILLGLNDKQMTIIKSLRIGSFGVFAVAGIILGLYMRNNDSLAPTTTDLKKEYRASGFSEQQALYYVALKKFKYVPVGWFGTSVADTIAMSTTDDHDKTILFSSDVDLDACRKLRLADSTFPKEEIFYTYESAGGVWKKLADALKPVLPDQIYVDGLLGIRDSFCTLGKKGTTTIEGNPKLLELSLANNSTEIKNTMRNSGVVWESIANNTEQRIPEVYQVKFYLTVIKILSNENNN